MKKVPDFRSGIFRYEQEVFTLNRQFTEEEMHAADCLQEMQRIISQLHITDETFLEDTKSKLSRLKELLNELEKYTME
jgi:ATP-dependent Zn protease